MFIKNLRTISAVMLLGALVAGSAHAVASKVRKGKASNGKNVTYIYHDLDGDGSYDVIDVFYDGDWIAEVPTRPKVSAVKSGNAVFEADGRRAAEQ